MAQPRSGDEDGRYPDYKTYSRQKCIYIKWSTNPKHLFPDYRDVSGSYVSQRRINIAKKIVILLLLQEERKITKAFESFARCRYRKKKVVVLVDTQSAIERVANCKLKRDNEYDYGEADEEAMWISACKLSDEKLVGVILHEVRCHPSHDGHSMTRHVATKYCAGTPLHGHIQWKGYLRER